ncbi:MAG: tetratricopeptide repeat protein [Proteobacteria bacterium]|nr:tetratricopeptide repeat protein [Pseudomonadota bacterium]
MKSHVQATAKGKRRSTEAFLLSGPYALERRKSPPGDTLGRQAHRVLGPRHKGLAFGKDFVTKALDLVKEAKAFAALAVVLDPGQDPAEPESTWSDHLVDVGREFSRLCERGGAYWGVLDSETLAACLPGKTPKQALALADSLRKKVRGLHWGTVSVGVAVWPTADFGKQEIFENIVKALDHAAFFGPDQAVAFDAVSLNVSGDRRYQDGDVAGAMAEYGRALLLDPREANVLNSMGVCHGVLENFNRAQEFFRRARAAAPKDVVPVYNQGLAHMLSGRPDQALEELARAMEMEPGVFEVHLQTGRVHLLSGDPGKALPYLEQAVELSPKAWAGHKHLADALAALGRHPEAARAYERVLALHPNDAESLSALAGVYTALEQNPDIALSFSRQSVDLCPENGLFRFRLGELYERRNSYARALAHYLAANELGHPCLPAIEKIRGRVLPEG